MVVAPAGLLMASVTCSFWESGLKVGLPSMEVQRRTSTAAPPSKETRTTAVWSLVCWPSGPVSSLPSGRQLEANFRVMEFAPNPETGMFGDEKNEVK
jgi:hypothetical protein